ncbi:hypothetical protein ACM66B_002079 [Microbotryomycetes sp. NB124-2]
MVLLKLTPALEDKLVNLHLPVELQELVDRYIKLESALSPPSDKTIPHEVLVKVAQWTKVEHGPDRSSTLASLLRLTDVYAPPLPKREKSPQLLAILAKIQQEQDQQAYDSMTSLSYSPYTAQIPTNDPYLAHKNKSGDGGVASVAADTVEEWKQIKRQVGAIVNVIVSMMTVATGVWWVGGGRSVEARLALAMFGAIAIAAIEGFLYYRFFLHYSGDATKQRRKVDQQRRLQLGAKTASLATKKMQ